MANAITRRRLLAVALWLALSLLPQLLTGDTLWANWFYRLAVVAGVVLLTRAVENSRRRPWLFLILLTLLAASTTLYLLLNLWSLAWAIVIAWFSILLLLGRQLLLFHFRRRFAGWLWTLLTSTGLTLISGMGLAFLEAVLSNFAQEEFFIAATGAYLAFFWLILALGYHLFFARPQPLLQSEPLQKWTLPALLGTLVLALAAAIGLLSAYQRSFFPLDAPTFAGISEQSPFVCEQTGDATATVASEEIIERVISLLEANPDKDTLTWGSLALYSNDPGYAAEFRRRLLDEAAQNLYTSPAHSIKWGQYEAALRVHLLELIDAAFPDLFSQADWQTLSSWFADINRRAMTVEWVDWLYATAYGKRPQGPYENQEIGSGLLAVLVTSGLAADELVEADAAYLNQTPLGWQEIFRNTDDAYFYQDIWLANAWWIYQYRQSLGTIGETTDRNQELSLLWPLLLSLPDAESLNYNTHWEPPAVNMYLFAAALSGNPQLSWLAGKALANLQERGEFLRGSLAVPALALSDGRQPNVGSCLIFANSGTPIEKGPLAPDKVVLRSGWSDDSLYALLNLRFTGWHRYKATNTLTLLYQEGPLVSERWTPEDFWWLPSGRSDFRDKRVPREYLNGLLLPKIGLPEVLWRLTGAGGPWLQDPPPYATEETFLTSDSLDMATTVIDDWRGWQHARTLYQIGDGLVLIVDEAESSGSAQAPSVIWHLNGSGQRTESGLRLDNERRAARMIWPNTDDNAKTLKPLPAGDAYLHDPEWELLYTSPVAGELKSAAAFLTREYTEGEVNMTYAGDREGILTGWSTVDTTGELLHNFGQGYLETEDLGTDGTTLTLIRTSTETQLCYAGGQSIRVRLPEAETLLSIADGASTLDPALWAIEGEWLTISPPSPTGCLRLFPE